MTQAETAACWETNAETWTRHARAGFDVYRDRVNTPAFLAMLPLVTGLHGLDVGCGEGGNTREVARRGARMTALDMSPTFLRHAREAEASEPLGIAHVHADAACPPFADEAFDFATAFMSLMDMRTLSAWINLVVASGFVLERLGEPCADDATAAAVPAVADTRVAPLFLHVRGRKLAAEDLRR